MEPKKINFMLDKADTKEFKDFPKEESILLNSSSKLPNQNNEKLKERTCADFLCCRPKEDVENRNIVINKDEDYENLKKYNISNYIKNQKYNWFTFVPLVLLHQFSFFSNQFFLMLSITQFIEVLQVGFLFSYVAPLVFVLLITLIKEFLDELNRFKRDKETNNEKYKKVVVDIGNKDFNKFKKSYYQPKKKKTEYVPNSDLNEILVNKQDNDNEPFDEKKNGKSNFNVEINNKNDENVYYSENTILKDVCSKDIRVGDVIVIEKNQRIPADCLLLKSFDPSESCFIKTDQLDGETDWKHRKAISVSQKTNSLFEIMTLFTSEIELQKFASKQFKGKQIEKKSSEGNLHNVSKGYCFEIQPPKKDIYYFKGSYRSKKDSKDPLNDVGLDLSNTMWSTTVLASNKCIALVIYVGKETRARMNTGEAEPKVGILDHEINFHSKLLFLIMFLCSVSIVLVKGINSSLAQNVIVFMRFIVLLSAIIPISLKVNLDISKTINSWFISKDDEIPDTLVRNSTLPEELGRIEMIFSDKTGTLTKNEMIFRRLYLENELFDDDNLEEIKKIVKDDCKKSTAPMLDIKKRLEAMGDSNENFGKDGDLDIKKLLNKRKLKNRAMEKKLRDSISAMTLCNCVTPVYEDDRDASSNNNKLYANFDSVKNQEVITNSKNSANYNSQESNEIKDNDSEEFMRNRTETKLSAISNSSTRTLTKPKENDSDYTTPVSSFQASSPDEVSLVKFCWGINMRLISRTDKLIELKNLDNYIEKYEILAEFPFTSESKRMGIIVKNIEHGHIIFYMKGAENVIEKYCSEDKKSYIIENSDILASSGLRTLVFTQKILSERYFNNWIVDYNAAKNEVNDDSQKKIAEVISRLEKDMEYLCVSGVEDLLQDNVAETIETLQMANIKIWMLTGDKIETAKCIAISTNLRTKNQKEFTISGLKTETSIEERLRELSLKGDKNTVLFIDGESLGSALKYCESLFFETCLKLPGVICCRCSPSQKALILETVKKYTNKRTLAIGDGGNDVSMILKADLGVGVVGKEGMQASLAADYSITKFSHLGRLLLWFGRISYKNTSKIAIFVIHRGLIISLIQLIFSFIFYCSPIPLYNGMLVLGYSTIYTSLPVMTLLLDREITNQEVKKFPEIYKELQKGRLMNFKAFTVMVLISLFQAGVIMCGSLFAFDSGSDLFLNIVTITFSALILSELLNVYLEVICLFRFLLGIDIC